MTKKKMLTEIFEQTKYDEKFFKWFLKRPFDVIEYAYDEFMAGEFCVLDCYNYIMRYGV
jgi:hypothetical protein